MHAFAIVYMYAYMHTFTSMHTHVTHTYIHTYINTHTCAETQYGTYSYTLHKHICMHIYIYMRRNSTWESACTRFLSIQGSGSMLLRRHISSWGGFLERRSTVKWASWFRNCTSSQQVMCVCVCVYLRTYVCDYVCNVWACIVCYRRSARRYSNLPAVSEYTSFRVVICMYVCVDVCKSVRVRMCSRKEARYMKLIHTYIHTAQDLQTYSFSLA
jgi:hypothetical protein